MSPRVYPLTTVLHVRDASELAQPFAGSESQVHSPTFEAFEDGEVGARVALHFIRDHRVLIVGDRNSPAGILGAYDLACAAQQYGAAHLGILFSESVRATSGPADVAFDRLMGHIFRSVPRAPLGNEFFTFTLSEQKLDCYSLQPPSGSEYVSASRSRIQDFVARSLGAKSVIDASNGSRFGTSSPTTHHPEMTSGASFAPGENPYVLSIRSYDYLKKELLAAHGWESGEVAYHQTSAGLPIPFAPLEVRGREVVILGGTPTDEDFLELAALVCSVVEQGASQLTVVMPYFGYSRMDRAVEEGDVVTAKSRARLLSYLPQAVYLNTFMLFDLHTFGVQHYFEGSCRRSHLYLEDVLTAAIAERGLGEFKFIVSPDIGHAKWTRAFARKYGLLEVVVDKVRVDGSTTGDFRILVGKEAIGGSGMLHDDLTCTASTAIGAGKKCQELGPESLYFVLSHGVFSPGAVERLRESGIFRCVIVSNSHPRAHEACKTNSDFLHEVSITPAIARALMRGVVRA